MPNIPPEEPLPLVLYDGTCGLCTRSVHWILRHERAPTLQFASQESELGQRLLNNHDAVEATVGDGTLVLIEGTGVSVRSEAVLRIARHLRFPWRYLSVCRVLPRGVRDCVYRFVARHRQRVARAELCAVLTPEQRARFIDLESS